MSRKKTDTEETEAVEAAPAPLSLAQALGLDLNIDQAWTPNLSPDGAVIGAIGADGTKVHLRRGHGSAVTLEFV